MSKQHPFLILKYTNMLISQEHDDFLQSIIKDIDNILCDCNCDCNDCNTTQKEYNDILVKITLFYSKYNTEYSTFLTQTFDCLSSVVNEEILCILLNEKIKGKFENTNFIKGIISYFYTGFYNKFINDTNTTPEEVNLFFKYDKISKCINKLGFNLTCFETNTI